MQKTQVCLWFFCIYLLCIANCFAGNNLPQSDSTNKDNGWVIIPAGTKATYMGIHGGTMPVSLFISNNGDSLISFVGNTGNDFLEVLRKSDINIPSLLNGTIHNNNNLRLQPFGLSDKALSIEGSATKPEISTSVKYFRLFFQPHYLNPRHIPN